MQIWDDNDAFLFCLGIPHDNLGESLAGLRLKSTTDLQRFPDGICHRRELALLPYPLKALQATFVETEYDSLCLSHVGSPFRNLRASEPMRKIPNDITNVNK